MDSQGYDIGEARGGDAISSKQEDLPRRAGTEATTKKAISNVQSVTCIGLVHEVSWFLESWNRKSMV